LRPHVINMRPVRGDSGCANRGRDWCVRHASARTWGKITRWSVRNFAWPRARGFLFAS